MGMEPASGFADGERETQGSSCLATLGYEMISLWER